MVEKIFSFKKTLLAVFVPVIIASGFFVYNVFANVGVTPATGGTIISIDTTSAGGSGAYTTLGNIRIQELVTGEIKLGGHRFTLPTGWEFDPTSQIALGADGESGLIWAPPTVSPSGPTYTSFSFTITGQSFAPANFTISGLKVRPTGTISGITGNITYSGYLSNGSTGSIINVDGTTNFGTLSSIPGAANYLAVTGGATATAGVDNELTITAHDQFGNVATSYSGSKNLTFSGLNNSPDSNIPKVETVNFGTPVSVNFTSGVSNASAATLVAYKAEIEVSVDVTDGTINSTGNEAYDLDVAVGSANAGRLEMTAVTNPIIAGDLSGTELTIYAKDAFGNLDINYTGGKNLNFSGVANSPAGNEPTVEGSVISSPVTVTFASGITNGTNATLVAYRAEGPVELEVSDGSINSNANVAYDVDLIVRHTTADHLEFSTSVTSPKVAGAQFTLPALNAVDIYRNIANGANGATAYSQTDTVAYDLSGLDNGPTSGADVYTTSVTFASGVSTTALNTTLYRAQSTMITANSALLSGTDEISNSFTVNAAAASLAAITQQPANTNDTVDNSLQQQPIITVTDAYGNVASNGETVTASVVTGTGAALRNPTATTANGIATFSNLGYNKSGESFTVKFTVGGINSVESSSVVALNPGNIHHFTVAEITDPVGAGVLTSPTVTAYDQYNNVKINYIGTIQFTKTDNHAQSLVPVNYTFVGGDNGTHTFTDGVKLATIGEQTVSVNDTVTTTAAGAQSAITVTVGPAAKVRVETAANGFGTVVAMQEIIPGNSITVYSITRDEYDNFVTNEAADSWSLVGFTGNLVVAGDSKSAVFNAIDPGAGTIHVVEGELTSVDSGTITVTPLNAVYVATTGNDTTNPGTSSSPKLTIQAGVNVVATSGVVNVAAGTYTETVTINKKITLQGAGDTTIINPVIDTDGIVLQGSADESIVKNLKITTSNSGVTSNLAISISAADSVVIEGVTILTTGNKAMGVWVCGTTSGCGHSDNLTVKSSNITITNSATGLYAEEASSAHTGWAIGGSGIGNTVNAPLGVAMEFYDVSNSTVSYNNVNTENEGAGLIAITYSSELSSVSGVTFDHNIIAGNNGAAPRPLFWVESNFITGAGTEAISGLTISNNTFRKWTNAGLMFGEVATGNYVLISSVTVSGNTFDASAATGPAGLDYTDVGDVSWNTNTWSNFSSNGSYPTKYVVSGSVGIYDNSPVGALSASATEITVSSPTVADGTAVATVTITAKGNNSGNILAGIPAAKISFTVSGSNNSLTQPSSPTDGSGVTTGTFTSIKAESKTITVTIDGVVITSQPTAVLVAGPIHHYTMTPGTITDQIAGTPFAVTIQAQDVNNNNIGAGHANAVETVNIAFGSADAGATPVTVDTVNGAATVNITLTKAQIGQTLNFTGATSGMSTGVSNAFNVTPGVESYLKVVAASATPTAGTNNELTITAYDAYGNVATGYTGTKSLTFSGLTASPSGAQATVEGVNIGSATAVAFTAGVSNAGAATLIAKKSEMASLDVADSSVSSSGNVDYDADLVVSPATIAALDVSAIPNPLTTALISTITVNGTDTYGNIVDDDTTQVSFLYSGDSISPAPAPQATLINGTVTTTMGKTTAGSVLLRVTAAGLSEDNVSVVFSDGTAPQVSTSDPVLGSANRSINTIPTLTFSEDMDVATLIGANIKLMKIGTSDTEVSAVVTYSGLRQVIITPSAPLAYSTQYYFTISASVTDANGVIFTAWDVSNKDAHKFTTEAAETEAPYVANWTPADNSTNVPVDTNIILNFNEKLDQTGITSKFKLRPYTCTNDNCNVQITVTYNDSIKQITINPNSNLSYGQQYYIYVVSTLKDLVGNEFGSSWQFDNRAQHEFTTIQGMTVQVYAEKTDGSALNTYMTGWRYRYEMTLNTTENRLSVKFPTGWLKSGGGGQILPNGNMRMLIDEASGGPITGLWSEDLIGSCIGSGTVKCYNLDTNYFTPPSNIDALDSNSGIAGRQIIFYVFTKIPTATTGGIYTANYNLETSNYIFP